MNDEEFKIEKGIPLSRPQKSVKYRSDEIPFKDMEVGDSIAVPLRKLIYGNDHPDGKERHNALAAMVLYLKRRFPDKKFIYRTENIFKYSHPVHKKSSYGDICVRFWRMK